MNDDLVKLENWVAPLLERLQPAARRRLSRSIGIDLRRSQQRRIAAQQNPDGTAYAPRRQASGKSGRVKRGAMFRRIRQTRFMKVIAGSESVSVGFTGSAAQIARTHQLGLKEPQTSSRIFKYPRRRLLGFSRTELDHVLEVIARHLDRT